MTSDDAATLSGGATVQSMTGTPGQQLPAAPQPPAAPSASPTASAWPSVPPAWPVPQRAADPDRTRRAIRSFALSPFDGRSWRAVLAIGIGFGIAMVSFTALMALFSTGGSLLIWLVGIPIVAIGIEAARLTAMVERWRMSFVDGRPLVAHGYRRFPGMPQAPYGEWLRAWAEAQFLDVDRWRDVVYVLLLFPLAVLEFTLALVLWVMAVAFTIAGPIAILVRLAGGQVLVGTWADRTLAVVVIGTILTVVGLFLIPVAASTSRGLMALHRAVVQGLLCVDPTVALRQDVARLRGSRSAALELEASELRRFERDLHDGAQQRLVRLAMDLGLAEEKIDVDPAGAKVLVTGAREQAQLALSEIRDLVRGTAPSILLDRGLVAAVSGVAASCPVPTTVDSGLADGERLPASVERAAYFVVAESLANVGKHAGATRCEVTLRHEAPRASSPGGWPGTGPTAQAAAGGRLIVDVRDDGVGGAAIEPGGGLAGLRDRAEALDGVLFLISPTGGPTVVHVEIPIAEA